jgi:hypothetical protein
MSISAEHCYIHKAMHNALCKVVEAVHNLLRDTEFNQHDPKIHSHDLSACVVALIDLFCIYDKVHE